MTRPRIEPGSPGPLPNSLPTSPMGLVGRVFIYIYIYIVIHRQTVSFYQNSSVWLDPQDARERKRERDREIKN